jgi:hypothetical protein
MKENRVSDTAIKTACWRAYHSHIDNPKIFNDFLAYDLVGNHEYEAFETMYVEIFKTFAPPEFASSFSDDAAILKLMMQSLAAPALVLSPLCPGQIVRFPPAGERSICHTRGGNGYLCLPPS